MKCKFNKKIECEQTTPTQIIPINIETCIACRLNELVVIRKAEYKNTYGEDV